MAEPENRRDSQPRSGKEEGAHSDSLWRRVWSSIFRGPIRPRSDRDRAWVVFNHLLLHFRPTRLKEGTLRYTHTFGLGGMSLVLVLLLAASGVLLMFVYEPTPETAYRSIVTLQQEVLFGKLVRNLHHWSANFLIVIAFLHLLRVYFTGAYHGARQFNWVLGSALLLTVLASNFTGYLLPWDQLSYWAITICTGMLGYVPGIGAWLQNAARGGSEIGSATLINFYTFHTTLFPILLFVLMGFHFWRVRKAKGVVSPRFLDSPQPKAMGERAVTGDSAEPSIDPDETQKTVLALPNLLMRELAVGLALVALLLLTAVFFDAPLGAEANPGMSPNPAKAPWYFMGFQELLLHFDPLFAVVILPLATILGLSFIPYVRYGTEVEGVWFLSRKGRQMGTAAAFVALVATPLWIIVDERFLDWSALLPGLPPVIVNGLLPVVVLAAIFLFLVQLLKRRFDASVNEIVQTSFVALTTVFLVLTATGIWFRGQGMALVWPWGS
jgi:quinol-cytochrome oxidoreductase complex cytochrome b subunit